MIVFVEDQMEVVASGTVVFSFFMLRYPLVMATNYRYELWFVKHYRLGSNRIVEFSFFGS